MEMILIPSSYKAPFKKSANDPYEAAKLYTDTNSTASTTLRTASGTTGDIVLRGYDVSLLPENIEIKRVYFKAKLSGTSFDYCTNFKMGIAIGDTLVKSQAISMAKSAQIFEIEADLPITTLDLLQIGLVLEYTLDRSWSAPMYYYGSELHIEYEEVIKGKITSNPTHYVNPHKLTRFTGAAYDDDFNFNEALTNADSTTYAELSTDGYGVDCDIKFDEFTPVEMPENCKIDLAYVRVKFTNIYVENATLTFLAYSGTTKLGEFSATAEVEDPTIYYINLPNFRKKHLQNFYLVVQSIANSKYKTGFKLYGMDLVVEYSEGEEVIVTETAVKQGYSKKPEAIVQGSGIVTVQTPNTEGYIGNLYNDDLDDYAEFNYVPNVYNPDMPEEELKTLGIIKIDSPTFSSMGVPNHAIINNVKLTKVSLKTCENATPTCELYVQVGEEKSAAKSFVPSNDFVTSHYDTGDISVHKLALPNDKASFVLEWKSYDTPFKLKVKYLLWDITYTIGDYVCSIQFNDEVLKKAAIGHTEIDAAYAGLTKIYG